MIMKSKIKWVALVGFGFSFASLVIHLLWAKYSTADLVVPYMPIVEIFDWRPVLQHTEFSWTVHNKTSFYRKLWGPVKSLESLRPYVHPRGPYPAANWKNNGYIFVKIYGGFHEIRTSICDAVVVARLLNATLVIPELQETTSTKMISSKFKSFSYLYDEDQFINTLANDVIIVKSLPKTFKDARKNNELPVFAPAHSASVDFYLKTILPKLKTKKAIGLLITGGGCLQAVLPHKLAEFQRLRCRVAFHALEFRRELSELAVKIVKRLRSLGRPFLAFHPGLERDSLAYHGCAELFQDVHTELIQHRRARMIKHGTIQGNLNVESELLRKNGSCPLMPQEVAILLRAVGYPQDTIIYLSGGEIFGGQRVLIALRALFNNLVDRRSLSTEKEMSLIYGPEEPINTPPPPPPPVDSEKKRLEAWQKAGPRPRPLAPPASRPKFPHEIEGWWSWIAESDKEPEPTPSDLRLKAHKLLWEALDYIVSVEADAFFPGFDLDKNGRPGFASLVMGHRLYSSAFLKTYHPDRKTVVKLMDEIRDHLYKPNRTWVASVRKLLLASTQESAVIKRSTEVKPESFLSQPFPECGCQTQKSEAAEPKNNVITDSFGRLLYGGEVICPQELVNAIPLLKETAEEDYNEEADLDTNNESDSDDNSKVEDGQQNEQEEEMDTDE